MMRLTYLDERQLWLNGLTVRGFCRYQTFVSMFTDAGCFWFSLADYLQATAQPCVVKLVPLPTELANAALGAQLLPLDGWTESQNLYSWN
jgi:hypothetical protein